MLNERLDTARPFALNIQKTEASLNDTIGSIGRMIADIPAARERLGKHAPLTTGVDACESLAGALLLVSQGYRKVVEAHQHLANDRDDLGLRTVNWGDVHKCPPTADAGFPAKMSLVEAA
jgi:hypothetical protein